MAEEAENNDKNAPVSIKRAHGQEQQIKMDVLDMVNRAEDPLPSSTTSSNGSASSPASQATPST